MYSYRRHHKCFQLSPAVPRCCPSARTPPPLYHRKLRQLPGNPFQRQCPQISLPLPLSGSAVRRTCCRSGRGRGRRLWKRRCSRFHPFYFLLFLRLYFLPDFYTFLDKFLHIYLLTVISLLSSLSANYLVKVVLGLWLYCHDKKYC